MFLTLSFLAVVLVGGVMAFVVWTVRRDAEATRVRDAATEQWLDEQARRWATQEATAERAAEAMLAARQRTRWTSGKSR